MCSVKCVYSKRAALTRALVFVFGSERFVRFLYALAVEQPEDSPEFDAGCPDGSAGQPRIRRGAASNSGEAAGGAAPMAAAQPPPDSGLPGGAARRVARTAPNLTRGCPDGSAELPAGQPRMAAGLPRSHTAPLPRRRVILGTPVPMSHVLEIFWQLCLPPHQSLRPTPTPETNTAI